MLKSSSVEANCFHFEAFYLSGLAVSDIAITKESQLYSGHGPNARSHNAAHINHSPNETIFDSPNSVNPFFQVPSYY
jgi:hypothetical protein